MNFCYRHLTLNLVIVLMCVLQSRLLVALMHVKAWARPNARVRKYTEKIEYYTEVWLYYTEAWLWLTWQSIKKRVASEFRNVVS